MTIRRSEAFCSGACRPSSPDHAPGLDLSAAGRQPDRPFDAFVRAALQAFAADAGQPCIYHETMTWAYLLLLRGAHGALSRWGLLAPSPPKTPIC